MTDTDTQLGISAVCTANRRYVAVEITGGASTFTVLLTPGEVNKLQAQLQAALDRLWA